jgi:hypothetical protein
MYVPIHSAFVLPSTLFLRLWVEFVKFVRYLFFLTLVVICTITIISNFVNSRDIYLFFLILIVICTVSIISNVVSSRDIYLLFLILIRICTVSIISNVVTSRDVGITLVINFTLSFICNITPGVDLGHVVFIICLSVPSGGCPVVRMYFTPLGQVGILQHLLSIRVKLEPYARRIGILQVSVPIASTGVLVLVVGVTLFVGRGITKQ